MNTAQLIISVFAKDRPGIVRALSNAVLTQQGNWLESSLSRLCGQFAGIVHISVAEDAKASLLASFEKLAVEGIYVTLQSAELPNGIENNVESVEIVIEANDRPGIVDEIAAALAAANVNVEKIVTECESASMAGYELFRAHLRVALPETCSVAQLEELLEDVSDDLMVSFIPND